MSEFFSEPATTQASKQACMQVSNVLLVNKNCR